MFSSGLVHSGTWYVSVGVCDGVCVNKEVEGGMVMVVTSVVSGSRWSNGTKKCLRDTTLGLLLLMDMISLHIFAIAGDLQWAGARARLYCLMSRIWFS